MAASFRKAPVLESLFNSEYCKIFKGTYFEEDLWKAASENVFMKLRKIKNYSYGALTLFWKKKLFSTSMPETGENFCFDLMIGFSWSLYSHAIFLWYGEK